MTSTKEHAGNGTVPAWHAGFLRMVPAIRRHASALFRDLAGEERDEAIAEVTAVAMMDYLGHLEGAAPGSFDPAALAMAAALHVRHSERACGRESNRDVLSPTAQHQRGFKVEHLKQSCEADRLQMRIDQRQDRAPAVVIKVREDFGTTAVSQPLPEPRSMSLARSMAI